MNPKEFVMLKTPNPDRATKTRPSASAYLTAAALMAGLWSALPAPTAIGEPESLPELASTVDQAGSTPTPTAVCPRDIFDWLDTTETWPLASVAVGDQTYTRDQLTLLLDDEDLEASDAGVSLAGEIVAAKLNQERGIAWQPLDDLLNQAEAVLAGQGALPTGIDAEAAEGKLPLQLAESLAAYNEGDVTSSCGPSGAAAVRGETDGEILCPIRDKDWNLKKEWPLDSMEIGSKQYSERELRTLMERPDPGRTRPLDHVISEVAAARLNAASGVAAPGVQGILKEAERLIAEADDSIKLDTCSRLAIRLKTVAARLEILNSPYAIKGCRPPEVGLRDLPDIFDDPVIGACPPEIWGMAELHTHMFAEHSYNEGFIHGTVDDHQNPFLPAAQALHSCSGLFDHAALRFPHLFGMGFVSERLVQVKKWNGNGVASPGDTGFHRARRNGYDTRNCFGVCTGPGTCVTNITQASCQGADPGFCQDDVPGNVSLAAALTCNTKLNRAACEGTSYCGAQGSSFWSITDDLNPCWLSAPNCDAADTCLKRDPLKVLECNDLNQNECNNHPNECNWNAQCKNQGGSLTCGNLNQSDCNQYTAWCNWDAASCSPDSITSNLTCSDLDLNDCATYGECGAVSSCTYSQGSLTCGDLSQTECATYNQCSWWAGRCRSNVVNGSLTCSDLTQAHCGNHEECNWTTECRRLNGSFGCSDLNNPADCNQYGNKCDWNPGSCFKDPLVLQPFECNDLTQSDCATYSACGWEGECKHPLTAQSLECSDLTPTECANHWADGGCGLRDCSEVGCAWTNWGQCQWQGNVWPPHCGDHYRDWPAWDTPTHQQHFWGHLQDAWRRGLRVVSVSILEVDPISTLMPNGTDRTPYEVIMDQIEAAEHFAQDHQSWVEIAYSAGQARQIASSGKLAMVLTLEANFPFCKERPCGMGDDEENLTRILETLDEYVARGIRGYQVMSHFDTQFAGVAVYKKPIHLMQWFYEELSRDGVITAAEMDNAMEVPLATAFNTVATALAVKYPVAMPLLTDLFPVNGFDDLTDFHAILGTTGGISGLECVRRDNGQPERCATCLKDQIDCQNVVGLTPLGQDLVRALIDRQVMIDIAHLSERGVQDVWNVIQNHSPTGTYPIYVSHGDPRDALEALDQKGPHQEKPSPPWILDLIEQSGGMFGMRTGPDQFVNHPPSLVDNDCSGSTKSFAQALGYLVDRGLDVGFALDMNGMIANAVPRFVDDSDRQARRRGRKAVCLGNKVEQALQTGMMVDDPSTPHTDESRLNTKGFGHIGLLGAFVDDLDTIGLRQTYLDHLYGSAEAFVQMWENVP